jgi:hypothetical protein
MPLRAIEFACFFSTDRPARLQVCPQYRCRLLPRFGASGLPHIQQMMALPLRCLGMAISLTGRLHLRPTEYFTRQAEWAARTTLGLVCYRPVLDNEAEGRPYNQRVRRVDEWKGR